MTLDRPLLESIADGESSTLDFKQEGSHPDILAKEIVAFCNTAGGTLLIGVDDGGVVTGCDPKATEERIVNICRNNIANKWVIVASMAMAPSLMTKSTSRPASAPCRELMETQRRWAATPTSKR